MMAETITVVEEPGYYPQFQSHLWHYKKYNIYRVLRGPRLMYYRWLVWLYGQEKADDEFFDTFGFQGDDEYKEKAAIFPQKPLLHPCEQGNTITERNYTTE